MRKRMMASLLIVGLVLLPGHIALAQQEFTDPTKANVLREYGTSGTNLVTADYAVVGCGIDGRGGIDGSGDKDQFSSLDTTTDSATVTYTLAGPRLVASYRAELGGYVAGQFILEGWNGTEWVELANITDASGLRTGTFDPATFTKIRYTAIGKDGGTYFQVRELHVYSVEDILPLTSGHNFFRDQAPTVSKGSAQPDGPWANCGDPNGLKDYAYGSVLNAQTVNEPNGTRAFVAYTFAEPVPMKFGCLGGYDGQNWGNWECYTANDVEDEFGDFYPPTSLASLDANDFATIQNAGWTLQHTQGAGQQATNFAFNQPGEYRYLALVWDVQHGACAEFELFAPITHTAVTDFTAADPNTGSTTFTKSTTLDVTAFAATPCENGTSIVAYAATESELPPAADDPAWTTQPPATVTIADVTGDHFIYGWAKDDTGDVGFKVHKIYYRSPSTPMLFNDAAKANVLREYGTDGANRVTVTYDAVGCNVTYMGSTDGSGGKDQADNFGLDALGQPDTLTTTYQLPGRRTVGSYKIEVGIAPGRIVLQGWDGQAWVGWLDAADPSGTLSGSFEPITVTKIRYIAYGKEGGQYVQVRELHVYLAADQTANLTDGFSYIRDQNPTGIVSANSVAWAATSGPQYLIDADFTSHVKAQSSSPQGGYRAFVAYSFSEPLPMSCATLGGYADQTWGNWECYTANGDTMPPLQNLETNDLDTIQNAGWTLQHTHGAGQQAMNFRFNSPGDYKYLALVWDVQGGACVQFELFNPLLHATVDTFAVADPTTGSTTYTKGRLLNVTSFAATPSELGTAITGWAITQTDMPLAADDPSWLAEPPATCTITGDSGIISIYGWAKDDVGDIAGKMVSIKFRSPQDQMTFSDSGNVNVLRQLDPETGANLVTVTRQLTDCSQEYEAITDGSGLTEQLGGFDADTDSAVWTFTLPGERTIGSYMVELTDHAGASWVLEGFDGADWVELARHEPMAAGRFVASFDQITVTELRCTATGPSPTTYLQIAELHVYLTSGQTVLLTDGYDYLADQTPLATSSSQDSTAWVAPSGSPADLRDRNYQTHVKAQEDSPLGGTHAFMTWSFAEPMPMCSGTLGGYHAQAWSGWTVYTANGDTMPPLQSVVPAEGESIIEAIVAAGWTLQHAQATAVQSRTFPFTEPGDWQHIAIVWQVQNDAEVELELRGTIAGAQIAEFSVSDQTTNSTVFTNSAIVNVDASTDPVDAIGTWQITELDSAPAPDDPNWGALSGTYTIQGAEGTVTLYAWFQDEFGNIAGKTASILYSTAVPVISNVAIAAGTEPGSAVVTWDTDIPAEGGVNYGTVSLTGATPDSVAEGAVATSHTVTVTGLDVPAKNYKFLLVNNEIVDTQAHYWPKPWPIDGDANGDCRVNILDLIFIRNKLNQAVTTGDNWKADVNGDTRINILDLIYVRNKLNTQCP